MRESSAGSFSGPCGPLRTWAVDAPVVAGVDLPARALPDHRAAYLDYEGPVSGDRGTVRRWDEGTYRALEWAAGRVVVELAGRQLAGRLELRRTGPEGAGASETERSWSCRLGGKVD